MDYYKAPAQDIEMLEKVDVVVAGGGTAGVAAAVSAARTGARVMLIERAGFLGGTGTSGLMEFFGGYPYDRRVGFIKDVYDALEGAGGLVVPSGMAYSGVFFDSNLLKYVFMKMLYDAGVIVKLYSLVSEPIMEGNRIKGVIIEGKSGRQSVFADAVIDTTGDADIAARVGCEFQVGREKDGKTRPITMLFRVGGVDFEAVKRYQDTHPDQFSPAKSTSYLNLEEKCTRLFGFFDTAVESNAQGELHKDLYYLRMEGLLKSGTVIFNNTRIYDVDGSKTDDLTRATYVGMQQAETIVNMLRRRVPGFENVTLLEYGASLGIRQSRMLKGGTIFDAKDVQEATLFPDSVCMICNYGSPFNEQHSPDGKEGTKDSKMGEGGRIKSDNPFGVYSYFVPYSMLYSPKVDNLLLAGRCVSTTHLGNPWFRAMPSCFLTGQIVGAAAALASAKGVLTRDVPLDELRREIAIQGLDSSLASPPPVHIVG